MVDEHLLERQQVALSENQEECERERTSLLLRKEAEARQRVKEREEWLARKEMEQELQGIISKTVELEAESERLQRFENRLARAEDSDVIKRNTLNYVPAYQSSAY